MKCGRCLAEMEEGVCRLGERWYVMMFTGGSLANLTFEQPGSEPEKMLSWRHPRRRAFRCPQCRALTILPEAVN